MRIFQWLQVYPNEIKKVLLCLLFSIFIGICQCFVIVIPLSIFLNEHPAALLPYVYVGTSLFTLALGFVYSYIERQVSFYTLFSLLLLFMVIPLFFLNILILISKNFWISTFLLLWSQLVWRLTDLEFWGLMNRLLNLQQAKRLFGLIGAGSSLSTILAGLMIPLLMMVLNPAEILLFASATLVGCLVLLNILVKLFPSEMEEKKTLEDSDELSIGQQKITLLTSLRSPFILKLLIGGFLTNGVYYLLDIAFSTATQNYLITEEKITNFLGIFFGVSNTLELFGRLFLLPYLLQSSGIIVATLFLPVLTVFLLVLSLGVEFINLPILFFILVTSSKFFDEGIRFSILEPARLLMYQLLMPSVRLWVQAKNEIVMDPLASTVTSLMIIFLNYYFINSLEAILILTLIFTILTVINYLSIKKDYLQTLSESLGMRYFTHEERLPIDKNTLRIFFKYLNSPYPGAVIYSLGMLEKFSYDDFIKVLSKMLNHSNVLVKLHVINKIMEYDLKIFTHQIYFLSVFKEQEDIVRSKAILALAELSKKPKEEIPLEKLLTSPNLEFRGSAILGLLKYKTDRLKSLAKEALNELKLSSKKEERLLVLKIYNEMPDLSDSYEIIQNFIVDDTVEIRRQTLLLISKTNFSEFYHYLFENLSNPKLKEAAYEACFNLGDALALPFISLFSLQTEEVRFQLIQIMGLINFSVEKKLLLQNFLIEQLKQFTGPLKKSIWKLQLKLEYKPENIDHYKKEVFLQSERFKFLINHYYSIPYLNDFSFLLSSLKTDINEIEEYLLLLLSFHYPKDIMKKIMLGLSMIDEQQVGYALELIQVILEKKHILTIFPSLTKYHQKKEMIPSKKFTIKEFAPLLKTIVLNEYDYFSEITRSTAIYILTKHHLIEKEILHSLSSDQNELINETSKWALQQV